MFVPACMNAFRSKYSPILSRIDEWLDLRENPQPQFDLGVAYENLSLSSSLGDRCPGFSECPGSFAGGFCVGGD